MNCYHYDPVTGAYNGFSQADPDPITPDEYLIPAYATTITPPTTAVNQAAIYNDGSWSVVPDWRDHTYWMPDGGEHTITNLDEVPPVDALDAPPPLPPTQLAQEKITDLSTACDAAIISGFVSSALGSDHTYQSDRDDQINLIGASSAGVDMPYKCADVNGIWTYRQHTAAQLKQALADGAAAKLGHLQTFTTKKTQVEVIVADSVMTDDEKRTAIEQVVW